MRYQEAFKETFEALIELNKNQILCVTETPNSRDYIEKQCEAFYFVLDKNKEVLGEATAEAFEKQASEATDQALSVLFRQACFNSQGRMIAYLDAKSTLRKLNGEVWE